MFKQQTRVKPAVAAGDERDSIHRPAEADRRLAECLFPTVLANVGDSPPTGYATVRRHQAQEVVHEVAEYSGLVRAPRLRTLEAGSPTQSTAALPHL